MNQVLRIDDGADILAPKPVADVVTTLEELLQKAKDGDIIGIAVAALHRSEHASWSWSGDTNTASRMAGAISLLQHEYLKSWLDK